MPRDYLILCVAAALGGAINAIAGGGTLLTFPALNAIAGDAVVANATSTVALVPAALAALFGYRRELREERFWSWALLGPSLVGGVIGSLLVVTLPRDWFKGAVPWLILAAALLFAFQPQIGRWMGIGHAHGSPSRRKVASAVAFQLLVAIYGGYFGAGIGILMLSALALVGLADIHRMNAVKTLLGGTINGISAIVFIVSGNVNWPYALAMAATSAVGGYMAAHIARSVDRTIVRRIVVTIAFTLAAYYFYRRLLS